MSPAVAGIRRGTMGTAASDGSVVMAPLGAGAWEESLAFDRYAVQGATPGRPLGKELEEWIVRGLIKAMPTLKIEAYFQAKETWFAEYDYLVVAVERGTDDLIAVLASRWHTPDEDGLTFFQVTMQLTAERYQKTHLLKHMWRLHLGAVTRGGVGFPWIVTWRTCNPVAFNVMRIFTRIDGVRMYPRIDGAPQEPAMVEMARRIAARISPGLPFCPETGVLRGAGVPADFYPSLPVRKARRVDRYFAEHLTPEDRVLCILSIPTAAAKARILKAFGLNEAPGRRSA